MSITCENCGQQNSEFETSCVHCDHLIIREPDSFLDDLEPISDELEEEIREKLSSRLKIQGELGRGGMALVYRALDPQLSRQVAVKCMPVMLNRDQTILQRFRREAQVMANLNHPHIVRVYSVDYLEGIHYFTMALLSGGSLTNKLRLGLTIEESIRIVREAASALDYAHGKGLVHRDIKPGNIMFDEHGATQILDFGIAKVLNRTQLTMTRSFMGTPYYMSPEQAKGIPVDGRCDLYALGVVFYQMVTHSLPFDSDDPMTVIYMHTKEKPKPPIKMNDTIPPAVSKIIMKLLEKDPNKRFQTGADLVATLNTIMAPTARLTLSQAPRRMPTQMRRQAGMTLPLSADQFKTMIPRPIQKRPLPILGSLAGLLLLIAILLPVLLRSEPPTPEPPPAPTYQALAQIPHQIPEICPPLPEPKKEKTKPKPKAKPPKPQEDPRVIAARKRVNTVKALMEDLPFVTMPQGSYRMGARMLGRKDAKPMHTVALSAFDLSKTEVTQALWQAVMGSNPSCHQGPDLPVENVSYNQVLAFMAQLSKDTGRTYRLPTEAEWEYAAKAAYDRSANILATAWHDDNTRNSREVATREISRNGLYDMQGNVREWCLDWYDESYYKRSPQQDPMGPEAGTERVLRGGGWQSKAAACRPNVRDKLLPDMKACDVGFRLVQPLPPQE